MTGFGRGETARGDIRVSVEIRTVNNRFLDIQPRLSRPLTAREDAIRDQIRTKIHRGTVNISVNLNAENGQDGWSVDLSLAERYVELLNQLRRVLNVKDEITLSHLVPLSEKFLVYQEPEASGARVWGAVRIALRVALQSVIKMRREEGRALAQDMRSRIQLMARWLNKIEQLTQKTSQERYQKLEQRIKKLTEGVNLDPNRLYQEVALLAERSDISEECVRLKSHLRLFLDTFKEKGPVGKRLNFILQEMNREVTTLSVKAGDAAVSHLAIGLKEEIEKIREQVQNVE
ncbi:YicC family protein [candidate division KSB1 bacterium]|nr:YicC family protein [candidate division KSB1 bacterium]